MRDIKVTRPTQISVDANFPVSGKAKNISSAGDNTGTPWIEDIINDRSFGWQERILSIAGIVPNGLEENASQSQISEAIEILIKIVSSGYNAVGSFRWGLVYTSDNDVGVYLGKAYKYIGGDSYPVTVPANTVDPSSASDYEEVVVATHNSFKNRNAVGAHDDIYNRKTTISEIESGVFPIGSLLQVSDRSNAKFNVISGGTANGLDIIDAGNGNTAVLFGYDVINLKYLGFSESNSAAQNTVIFNRAKELSNLITGTAGEFNLENLVLDKDIYLTFAGRTATKLNISGFVTYGGLKTSCLFKGDDTKGLESLTNLEGVEINITNAEPNSMGAIISRKTNWFDVYIHGATRDGIYFRAFDANNESPYFCNLTNVWSKSNGRNGVTFTDNCNANVLTNGQFDSNGERGVVQTQVNHGDTPIAVYNNTLVNGQTSYNQFDGIYVERGSEFIVSGTYTEFNSQADGGNPKTGAYKNLRINNLAARCKCFLGSVGTSTDVDQVVDAGSNLSNEVYVGGVRVTPYNDMGLGYKNSGTGKKITFNGAGGCSHTIEFAEGTTVPASITYNGAPASPFNEVSFNVNSGVAPIKYLTNGYLAFFGATPVSRPSVSASATDPTTTQTLANELRQALIDLGLIS